MKKLIVLFAVVIASASVASAQDWGIGGRLGYGVQVVGQKYFGSGDYLEARLGLNGFGSAGVELSALYTWNTFNWDWTPGNWFLDFGVGGTLTAVRHWTFVGVQGMAKFGYTFEDVPLSLAIDYSPAVGPHFTSIDGVRSDFLFAYEGIALSAVYRF